MNTASLRRAGFVAAGLVGVFVASQIVGYMGIDSDRGLFRIPLPVMLLALVFGCLNALTAIGVVLIYRATRIINFAHAGFGGVAAMLFFVLVAQRGWPYVFALPVSLAAGAATGVVIELFFIRRFAKASRLVLTVVTLGVAQLLAGIAGIIPTLLGDEDSGQAAVPETPFSRFRWSISPINLTGNHVALMVATVVLLLAFVAFFRYTSWGIAIRGAAENDDRASLLGINTGYLASLVWGIAALLSAVAAVLQVPITGMSAGAGAGVAGVGSALLLRALFAAVVGGMENLPITVAAALGVSVFEQSVFFAYSQTAIVDGVILVLIVAVLLLQRKKLARTEDSGSGTWAATEEVRPVPNELAHIPSVRAGLRRVLIGGAVVLLAYPWVMSPSQTSQGSLFAIYGIIVVSLVVLTGWGGQISLGQFGFVAIGAVVGGSLISRANWPFIPSLLLGSLAGALSAVLIGLPALRIRGLFLAVTTLAFSVATATVVLNQRYFGDLLPTTVNRPKLMWIEFEDERAFYYLCLLGLGATVFAALGIRHARTGRALIAMRDNERGAQAFGLNLVRIRLATFAISGFFAAFAGVLFAAHQHSVNQQSFTPDQSIQIFLMAVIGGLGSVPGALTGALYLGILNIVTTIPIGRLLGSSIGVLLILMFFPGGLGAAVFKLRDAALRRVAIRRRIYVPSLLGGYGMVGGQMARAPLSAKLGPDGSTGVTVPRRYRIESRILEAGTSQTGTRWSF